MDMQDCWFFTCYLSWTLGSLSKCSQLKVFSIGIILVDVPAFSIWKSLQVLEKASIKMMACAIYTYLVFSYTCTLLFWWKTKSYCDCCFLQQIILQKTVQLDMLLDYSSVRIGFNMINKCLTLPVVYTMLV